MFHRFIIMWSVMCFFLFCHQSFPPTRGAGLPQTAVLQRLQERPLLSGPGHHGDRAHPPETPWYGPVSGSDAAGSCGSGRSRTPAATDGSVPAGGHVFIRGRRKPEVHLRAARMGGGDAGQSLSASLKIRAVVFTADYFIRCFVIKLFKYWK